jgi:TolA-binding protein
MEHTKGNKPGSHQNEVGIICNTSEVVTGCSQKLDQLNKNILCFTMQAQQYQLSIRRGSTSANARLTTLALPTSSSKL